VGCVQAPHGMGPPARHRLASGWCSFKFRSTLPTVKVALFRCMFVMIFVTHNSMMTIPTLTVWTSPWHATIHVCYIENSEYCMEPAHAAPGGANKVRGGGGQRKHHMQSHAPQEVG